MKEDKTIEEYEFIDGCVLFIRSFPLKISSPLLLMLLEGVAYVSLSVRVSGNCFLFLSLGRT